MLCFIGVTILCLRYTKIVGVGRNDGTVFVFIKVSAKAGHPQVARGAAAAALPAGMVVAVIDGVPVAVPAVGL